MESFSRSIVCMCTEGSVRMCRCICAYGTVLERFDFLIILVVFALAQKLTQFCLFIDENQSDAQATPSADEYKCPPLCEE